MKLNIKGVTIKYEIEGTEAHIELLYTPKNLRGQGRAREALVKFEELMRDSPDVETIGFFCEGQEKETDTKRLTEFYRELGYRDIEYDGLFTMQV